MHITDSDNYAKNYFCKTINSDLKIVLDCKYHGKINYNYNIQLYTNYINLVYIITSI